MSKWLIGSAVIFALLLILFFTGRKSVHTEVIIPATVDQVWSVLTDTDQYEHWNNVLVPLEGELIEGTSVKYQFQQDDKNAYAISSKVKHLDKNRRLNQGGGVPVFLTFDHFYLLESTEQGTKVIIHEDYRGIGVHFWNPKPVEEAYIRLIQALKNRVLEVYP